MIRSYVMIALAACSWGTWRTLLLAAERAAPGLDARVESAVVMLLMTVFAFGYLRASHEERPPQRRTLLDWTGVAWLGVADAMNVLLLFAAYGHTTVAIAVTTHYLAPILVAVAAPLLLREPARGAWAVALGGALGLVLLLRPWSGTLALHDGLGAAAGAGSALFYASNVLVNRRMVQKFSAAELMAYHGVFATPVLFAIAPRSGYGSLTLAAVGFLVVGAVVPGALAGIFFVRALRHVKAAHASTLTLLEPLVAVAIAVAFYDEKLAPISWVGAAMVIGCAAGVAYLGHRT